MPVKIEVNMIAATTVAKPASGEAVCICCMMPTEINAVTMKRERPALCPPRIPIAMELAAFAKEASPKQGAR